MVDRLAVRSDPVGMSLLRGVRCVVEAPPVADVRHHAARVGAAHLHLDVDSADKHQVAACQALIRDGGPLLITAADLDRRMSWRSVAKEQVAFHPPGPRCR